MQTSCDVPGLMPLAKAQKKISDIIQSSTTTEVVPLQKSLNRVSASMIRSPINVPGYDNSAMDGYAFKHQDLVEFTELKLLGKSFAGQPYLGKLEDASCVKVMTGAAIPEGADTVIMQENAHIRVQDDGLHQSKFIRFSEVVDKGNSVRYAGEDIPQNSVVVDKGKRINSTTIGLLASLGYDQVEVYKRVSVAMFSTGDELLQVGDPYEKHRIYDSNRPTIVALLERLNCQVIDFGMIPDNKKKLVEVLTQADLQADCVITSGGVSVGEADFIKEVLAEIGQIDFWKIAIKPGKPLAFGRLPSSVFFGLPGNPVSAFVTFHQIAAPAIRQLGGESVTPPMLLSALAGHSLRKRVGRTDFQRGRCFVNEEGQLSVESTGAQGSGVFSSFSNSNCYIVLEQERGNIKMGETVQVQLFDELLS